MPYSSLAGKEWIRQRLHFSGEVQKILDVGAGAGGLPDLFRSDTPASEWTGIEAWAPYIEKFSLLQKYDRLIVSDVRWIDLDRLGQFDVCFCGDVLEHMELAEAQHLVSNLALRCKLLFLSIPLGECEQGAVGGNPFERHIVDDFTHERVLACFDQIVASHVETVDGWTIGVYAISHLADVVDKLVNSTK